MLAKRRLASPESRAMDEDRLLSRKELAAALGVSTRTVDRWIREQSGPPATLLPSGRRRWRWGDVQAWLWERREGE
jgi:predicted DNA-binding transcriptional regulator AlpA